MAVFLIKGQAFHEGLASKEHSIHFIDALYFGYLSDKLVQA